MTDPVHPPSREPFWDYQDLAIFLGLALPLLLVSLLLLRLATPLLHHLSLAKEAGALLFQFVWYALWFGALYLLLRLRYRRAFWPALGWTLPRSGLAFVLLGGPVLAFATGGIGVAIGAPRIEIEPLQGLLGSRLSLLILIVGVAFLGPFFEELAFRGFLMPLFMRSLGPIAGILFTAFLFALLHGPEYHWSWRHVLLILSAGAVFGWVRYRTGSTLASTALHATYNMTFLAAFITQSGPLPTKW